MKNIILFVIKNIYIIQNDQIKKQLKNYINIIKPQLKQIKNLLLIEKSVFLNNLF